MFEYLLSTCLNLYPEMKKSDGYSTECLKNHASAITIFPGPIIHLAPAIMHSGPQPAKYFMHPV